MRVPKRFSYFLIAIALLLNFSLHANIENIPGTYSIFKSYQHLSSLHGAIAYETGTIRRMYDFGTLFDVEEAKAEFFAQQKLPQAAAGVPEMLQAPLQEFLQNKLEERVNGSTEAIQLVHKLFHRPSLESTDPSDFVLTKWLGDLVAYDPIKGPAIAALFVAHVLTSVESLNLWDRQESQLLTEPEIRAILEPKPLGKEAEAKRQPQKKAQPTSIKNLIEKKVETDNRLFRANAIKLDKGKEQYLKDRSRGSKEIFTLAINASLHPNQFPRFIVHLILLSVLYVSSQLDPKILDYYYKTLIANNLDYRIPMMPAALLHQTLVEEEKKAAAPQESFDYDTLKKFISTVNTPQLVHENYEKIAYVLLYPSFASAPYKTTTLLNQDGSPTDRKFTDCMDNAFRNLFNFLAFDDQLKFDKKRFIRLEKLNEINPGKLDPRLAEYYKNPIPITTVNKQTYHNEWTRVISNLPYVAYVRRSDSDKTNDWPGFIRIPTADLAGEYNPLKVFLDDHKYGIIESDALGYEIQPSARNIIIVLDTLLNLGLFTDQNPIAREFVRPDFVATYLPKVMNLIATNDVTYRNEWNGQIDLDSIDGLDLKGDKFITIKTKTFSISVKKDHGKFALLQEKETAEPSPLYDPEEEKKVPLQLIIEHLNEYLKALPYSFILLPRTAKTVSNLSAPAHKYLVLFSLRLDDPDYVSSYYLKRLMFGPQLRDLFLLSVSKHADVGPRISGICTVWLHYIKLKLPNFLDDTELKKALSAATQDLLYHYSFSAIELIETLVDNGQGIDAAIDAAMQTLSSQNYLVQRNGFELFKKFVAKDKWFEAAINAATQALLKSDSSTQCYGLELFEALVAKDKGLNKDKCLDKAVAAVARVLSSTQELDVQHDGLELFEALVAKDKGLDEAVAAAAQVLPNFQADIQAAAWDLHKQGLIRSTFSAKLSLLNALVAKGKGFDAASKAALDALANYDSFVQERGRKLQALCTTFLAKKKQSLKNNMLSVQKNVAHEAWKERGVTQSDIDAIINKYIKDFLP
ncbi:MAG: hypothetical protein WCW33_02880 [Candidatus Babeliales bacterium]